MKKILSVVLAVVMLFAVVALAGCSKDPANNDDNKAATLKFGLGVVASYGEAKDTSGEFIATAVAVLLDADGKIAKIDLDSVDLQPKWTEDGKIVALEDLRTKYDLGKDYGMGGNPYAQDVNNDGKVLEWNEQADAFMKTATGKTLAEVKAFVAENGATSGDLATAGCTINVAEFMAALEKAVANAADSTATAENNLKLALLAADHGSKDATEEADGVQAYDVTISAVVTDAEGKVVVAKTDCVSSEIKFNAKGEATYDAKAEVKTKLELGKDYGMGGNQYAPDLNGDGKVLEWNEQAAEFDKALVGKKVADFAGLADEKGNGTGDLATAGCTIGISDMIKAAEAAAKA